MPGLSVPITPGVCSDPTAALPLAMVTAVPPAARAGVALRVQVRASPLGSWTTPATSVSPTMAHGVFDTGSGYVKRTTGATGATVRTAAQPVTDPDAAITRSVNDSAESAGPV